MKMSKKNLQLYLYVIHLYHHFSVCFIFWSNICKTYFNTPLLLTFRPNRLFDTRLQIEMTFVFILRGPFNREISRVAKRSPYCQIFIVLEALPKKANLQDWQLNTYMQHVGTYLPMQPIDDSIGSYTITQVPTGYSHTYLLHFRIKK